MGVWTLDKGELQMALCGAGGQHGGVEGTHSGRPGWFSVATSPSQAFIPLTHNSPIPPYSVANPEPDDMSP